LGSPSTSLQSFTYGTNQGTSLSSTFVVDPVNLFEFTITPQSTNSTISFDFYLVNYYAGTSTSGGVNEISSYVKLVQSNTGSTTELNRITVNVRSSSLIFPNNVSYQNTSNSALTFQLWAGFTSGFDNQNQLRFDNSNMNWSCIITENQN